MIRETCRIYSNNIGNNIDIKDFAIIYENVKIEDDVAIGENSVIGRTPRATLAVVREITSDGETIIKKGVSISSNVIIYNNVRVGCNSLIGDNSSILNNVVIGEQVLISRNVTINSDVSIGDKTRIMDNSHITGRVSIGKNVFISVGVTMANDNSFGKFGFADNVKGPIIADDVSVGVGAIILPGIKIGRGSIIAAGSVVKNDVEENMIVSGNPAKVVSRVPKSFRRV